MLRPILSYNKLFLSENVNLHANLYVNAYIPKYLGQPPG